jgi:hypothetical protein
MSSQTERKVHTVKLWQILEPPSFWAIDAGDDAATSLFAALVRLGEESRTEIKPIPGFGDVEGADIRFTNVTPYILLLFLSIVILYNRETSNPSARVHLDQSPFLIHAGMSLIKN